MNRATKTGIVLAGVVAVGLFALSSFLRATPSKVPSPTPTEMAISPAETAPTPAPLQFGNSIAYLHGTGPDDNPTVLFLNNTAPTATNAKYRDSAGVNFASGNPWKEIGTWKDTAASEPQTLTALSDLRVWLGLKNSDDQGTQFDVRAEVYKNTTLISQGQTLCITGITRNANQAKETLLQFGALSDNIVGTGDVLSVKILTRIGTNPNGTKCAGPGGSHSNAVGLRLYFDAVSRPSALKLDLQPSTQPKITWSPTSVEVILSPGESMSKDFTFTSDQNLQNAVLQPVPALAGLLSIQPNSFASVPANQPQSVRVHFSIPPTATLGTFDGTIHVKVGSQTLPQTLKVVVNVWQKFTDAGLGVTLKYPPGWKALEVDGGVTFSSVANPAPAEADTGEEIDLVIENNPTALSLSDWLLSNYQIDLAQIPPSIQQQGVLSSGQSFIQLQSVVPSNNSDNIHAFVASSTRVFVLRGSPATQFGSIFIQILSSLSLL